MADKYLNLLYSGTIQTDATGRMTEPEYDMTLEQFNEAQDALEAALEEAKQEAEAEYEEAGQEITPVTNMHRAMAKYMKAKMRSRKYQYIPTADAA